MGLAHSLELAAVDKTKFGGLVGDSSIIKCNACKALVIQYGPIEIISRLFAYYKYFNCSEHFRRTAFSNYSKNQTNN